MRNRFLATVAVVALALAGGTLNVARLRAQSAAADNKPAFDVASLKSMVTHTETRDTLTWALVMARSDGKLGAGLRRATTHCAALRAAAPPGETDPCGLLTVAYALMTGKMRVRGLDLNSLAVLARDAGRPVVNETGLTGNFDWTLHGRLSHFCRVRSIASASRPSILTAHLFLRPSRNSSASNWSRRRARLRSS